MTDNQWTRRPSTSQLAGSDPYAHITETVQDLILFKDPQASRPTAVQTLPHVPDARGPAPMPRSLSPRGSGAWDQQPMSHDCTKAVDPSEGLANGSASPTSHRGMSSDGWTGRLYWDGAYIHARAKAGDAVRNPKLPEWPEVLQLEIVADSKLSTIDIQAWMRKTKCSMAVLTCICETDKCDFDQLVKTLSRDHSYAIVRWENQERLLLAPAGKALHCAAFPDSLKGIPERPQQRRPLQPLRVIKKNPKKPKGSRRKKRSPPGPQSNLVAMPLSPEGPYLVAAQNGIAPLQQQPEQVQVSDPLPHAMRYTYTLPDGGRSFSKRARWALTENSMADASAAAAASCATYSSNIDPGAGNANTFGSNAFSSLGSVRTASSEVSATGMFNKYVNMGGNGK